MASGLAEKQEAEELESLLGSRGCRRYLDIGSAEVTIGQKALDERARYEGRYVDETDRDLAADDAALACRRLCLQKALGARTGSR